MTGSCVGMCCAFTLNAIVPPTVDVRVEQGCVKLHGSVRWQFERAEAVTVAVSVPGVTGVLDEILLASSRPPTADVRQAIQLALRRSAEIDVDTISIRTTSGTVSITGTVRSWPQHDAVLAAVWAAPGVQQVQNGLVVSYDR
jgi:osmotically-inducible protein OsmY